MWWVLNEATVDSDALEDQATNRLLLSVLEGCEDTGSPIFPGQIRLS